MSRPPRMRLTRLQDGTRMHCIKRSEARFLDSHVAGYAVHGIDVPEGGVVFDVGANIGLFAVRTLQRIPGVTVFAFEPLPDIFTVLARNAEAFGEGRLRPIPCALGRSCGTATFDYYPNSPALSTAHPEDWERDPDALARAVLGSARNAPPGARWARFVPAFLCRGIARRLRNGRAVVTCDVRTVSDVVAEHATPRIHLLKIDCEGAEHDVLLGIAPSDWPKIDAVVVEVHDVDGRLDAVTRLLTNAGLSRLWVVREPGFEDTDLHNVFAARPRPLPRSSS